MRQRIRCLWHSESTASLVQRKDGWYCYGACQKLYTKKEVEERTGEAYEYEEEEPARENILEAFRRIESLPRREIRGLRLPADERGYFVCWPGNSYYKYRLFNEGKGPKYIGPKGHRPPLFWAKRSGSKVLYLSEGEVNALSLAEAFPEHDHCSPGSASMFGSENLSKYLTEFKQYNTIVVVLDDDPAGLKGLIEAKAFLLYKIPFVNFIQVKPDANEVLVYEGKEALREKLQRAHIK